MLNGHVLTMYICVSWCKVWTNGIMILLNSRIGEQVKTNKKKRWKSRVFYETPYSKSVWFLSRWKCVSSATHWLQFSSVNSVMSDSLPPHGLQQATLPCPSPTPRGCSNSCPLSWWCHPTISSSVSLLLLPSIFPSIRVFSNELVLHIRWSKYTLAWTAAIISSHSIPPLLH